MNKKIIWGIVTVMILIGAGATYIYSQKELLVTQEPVFNYNDWQTYSNKKYGVSINYPTKVDWGIGYTDNEVWFATDNSKDDDYQNGLSVGFGTASSKSGGFIWNLGVMNKVDFDLERYIKVTGEQFSDRQEKREKVYIGLDTALLVTVTSESNKSWISESVILEKGDKIYLMGNGAINQSKDFQQFYKSLKLTSPAPATSINGGSDTPIISSIVPIKGKIGSEFVITGKYLNGFEGSTIVSFTDKDGKKGYMEVNSYTPAGATTLKFTLKNQICTTVLGESGNPCPSYLTITPGVYEVSAQPWSIRSNKVMVTITN